MVSWRKFQANEDLTRSGPISQKNYRTFYKIFNSSKKIILKTKWQIHNKKIPSLRESSTFRFQFQEFSDWRLRWISAAFLNCFFHEIIEHTPYDVQIFLGILNNRTLALITIPIEHSYYDFYGRKAALNFPTIYVIKYKNFFQRLYTLS